MGARCSLIAGAILGFLGVALGAFGAHALKPLLEANGRLDTYELAVRYQFYHSLALLFIGLWNQQRGSVWANRAAVGLLLGVILFSGSLYVLALTPVRWIAFVTPLGGLSLLAGWSSLLLAFLRSKS